MVEPREAGPRDEPQEVREVLKAGHMRDTGQTGAVHVLHPGFCTYTEGGEQNGGKLKNYGMRSRRRSYCRLFSSQFEAHCEMCLTFLICQRNGDLITTGGSSKCY